MQVIASMIAPSVGLKNKRLMDFFPSWATPAAEDSVPVRWRGDLRVGLRLGLVSQDFLDWMGD